MQCYTFLYTRRSSDEDDRQTLSLDAQQQECQEYAAVRGIQIDETIRESHSARKPGRPQFSDMLKRVSQMRSRGTSVRILCHKTDRLLRNIADWARINDLMDLGVELLFVTGSYENNAQGKMAFGINVLFAKYYVDNLSEEVRKGIRQKLILGEWPGWAPLGYRNVREKDAPHRIVPDPDVAPLVRKAFEYYSTGIYSLRELAEQLETEGLVGKRVGKRLRKSYLQDRILRNPFYSGVMRYDGHLYPASHEALISTELFEKVQEVMRAQGKPRPVHHDFCYRGLLHCAHCGCTIVGELKKQHYRYYRCTRQRGACSSGYIREEELTHLLRQKLRSTLGISAGVARALTEAALKLQEGSLTAAWEERALLEQQVTVMERKKNTLLELRLSGQITDDEFGGPHDELVLRLNRLREGLRRLELPQPKAVDTIQRFIGLCNRPDTIFDAGYESEIREYLRIVGSNYRLGRSGVDFEPVKPFKIAAQARLRPQWCAAEVDVRNLVAGMTQVREPLPPLPKRTKPLPKQQDDPTIPKGEN